MSAAMFQVLQVFQELGNYLLRCNPSANMVALQQKQTKGRHTITTEPAVGKNFF